MIVTETLTIPYSREKTNVKNPMTGNTMTMPYAGLQIQHSVLSDHMRGRTMNGYELVHVEMKPQNKELEVLLIWNK